MKFKVDHCLSAIRKLGRRARAGFTLAEVLAAVMFMAIVIPAAVEGLSLASLAGEVAQRKAVAGRIANKVLNELLVENKLQASGQVGDVLDGPIDYHWSMKSQLWTEDPTTPMMLATVTVSYPARGRNYEVHLSTLVPQNTL
jgi:type II secretory pathway pseudopilin PulG